MVAYTGVQNGERWHLAPSLRRLVEETDFMFPNRSTISDGSIGDGGHQARQSDHNPGSDNIVSAVDITDDDNSGCNVSLLWNRILRDKDDRVKYQIHRGLIVKSYTDSAGHAAWEPYPYTGINGHFSHIHVSVLDNHLYDTGKWWLTNTTTPTPTKPITRKGDIMIFSVLETKRSYAVMPDGPVLLTEAEFWELAGGGMPVTTIEKNQTADKLFKGPRRTSFNDAPTIG